MYNLCHWVCSTDWLACSGTLALPIGGVQPRRPTLCCQTGWEDSSACAANGSLISVFYYKPNQRLPSRNVHHRPYVCMFATFRTKLDSQTWLLCLCFICLNDLYFPLKAMYWGLHSKWNRTFFLFWRKAYLDMNTLWRTVPTNEVPLVSLNPDWPGQSKTHP